MSIARRAHRLHVGVVALFLVPLLAACGGGSTATGTPTTAAKPTTTTAATSAASPSAASTTAPTSASAPGATTAAGSSVAAPATAAAPTTASGTTTAASTGADPRGAAPAKRGGGGTLHLLFWQAPTVLNVHQASSGNGKDQQAARIATEPLAVTSANALTPDVPVLAKEIPSTANGELSADGTSVTWKLKDGVKWSDGTPFTSADVKATYDYVSNPTSASADITSYADIAKVETPDATTVKITFKQPTALWWLPFTNYTGVVLQKAQLAACTSPKECPANTNPVGTGPYKVKAFVPGDNVQFVINDNYRDANAPYYDAIDYKGGGDAGTAAKAVIAGDADYAWNLQVAPEILKQVTDAGKALNITTGNGVERMSVNFTDPNKEVNGEKSSLQAPHPFQADPKVREAYSWLIDRESIAKNLYGQAAVPTCNVLPSVPPQTVSKNTKCGFDVAKANQLLDDAGWKKGADGIRAKNGVRMHVAISTTVNAVREKEEQVMKQSFQQAGIEMEIKNVDAGVFFGKPDNPDSFARFEKDLQLFSGSPGYPDSQAYFDGWTTARIAQKANGWGGANVERFSDPQFDALVDQLRKELNQDKRNALLIQCNDYIVSHDVNIPIVDRAAVSGRRTDLINTNPSPWDATTWNIAYWQIKK
jgi:peptide/nickel transport system substrate-binding protein